MYSTREGNSATGDIQCEIHPNTFLLISQNMTTMLIIVEMKKAVTPEIFRSSTRYQDRHQSHPERMERSRRWWLSWHCKILPYQTEMKAIPWISKVTFSLSVEDPLCDIAKHWNLVPLYSALAGMVKHWTVLPSGVLVTEIFTSLCISGGRSGYCVPLIFQSKRPPSVSHVNTADWSRKIVLLGFSAAWLRVMSALLLYTPLNGHNLVCSQ